MRYARANGRLPDCATHRRFALDPVPKGDNASAGETQYVGARAWDLATWMCVRATSLLLLAPPPPSTTTAYIYYDDASYDDGLYYYDDASYDDGLYYYDDASYDDGSYCYDDASPCDDDDGCTDPPRYYDPPFPPPAL